MMTVDCSEENFSASFDFSKFTSLKTPWLDDTWDVELRYIAVNLFFGLFLICSHTGLNQSTILGSEPTRAREWVLTHLVGGQTAFVWENRLR